MKRSDIRRFIRRGDVYILGAVLLLAAALGIWTRVTARGGSTVVITTPQRTFSYSLSRPQRLTLQGREGIVATVEIAGGRVRVETCNCADQTCVRTGWLSQTGQTCACLPGGLMLQITGDGVDAIAG